MSLPNFSALSFQSDNRLCTDRRETDDRKECDTAVLTPLEEYLRSLGRLHHSNYPPHVPPRPGDGAVRPTFPSSVQRILDEKKEKKERGGLYSRLFGSATYETVDAEGNKIEYEVTDAGDAIRSITFHDGHEMMDADFVGAAGGETLTRLRSHAGDVVQFQNGRVVAFTGSTYFAFELHENARNGFGVLDTEFMMMNSPHHVVLSSDGRVITPAWKLYNGMEQLITPELEASMFFALGRSATRQEKADYLGKHTRVSVEEVLNVRGQRTFKTTRSEIRIPAQALRIGTVFNSHGSDSEAVQELKKAIAESSYSEDYVYNTKIAERPSIEVTMDLETLRGEMAIGGVVVRRFQETKFVSSKDWTEAERNYNPEAIANTATLAAQLMENMESEGSVLRQVVEEMYERQALREFESFISGRDAYERDARLLGLELDERERQRRQEELDRLRKEQKERMDRLFQQIADMVVLTIGIALAATATYATLYIIGSLIRDTVSTLLDVASISAGAVRNAAGVVQGHMDARTERLRQAAAAKEERLRQEAAAKAAAKAEAKAQEEAEKERLRQAEEAEKKRRREEKEAAEKAEAERLRKQEEAEKKRRREEQVAAAKAEKERLRKQKLWNEFQIQWRPPEEEEEYDEDSFGLSIGSSAAAAFRASFFELLPIAQPKDQDFLLRVFMSMALFPTLIDKTNLFQRFPTAIRENRGFVIRLLNALGSPRDRRMFLLDLPSSLLEDGDFMMRVILEVDCEFWNELTMYLRKLPSSLLEDRDFLVRLLTEVGLTDSEKRELFWHLPSSLREDRAFGDALARAERKRDVHTRARSRPRPSLIRFLGSRSRPS